MRSLVVKCIGPVIRWTMVPTTPLFGSICWALYCKVSCFGFLRLLNAENVNVKHPLKLCGEFMVDFMMVSCPDPFAVKAWRCVIISGCFCVIFLREQHFHPCNFSPIKIWCTFTPKVARGWSCMYRNVASRSLGVPTSKYGWKDQTVRSKHKYKWIFKAWNIIIYSQKPSSFTFFAWTFPPQSCMESFCAFQVGCLDAAVTENY